MGAHVIDPTKGPQVQTTIIGGKRAPVLTGSRAHLRRPARPRTVPAPEAPAADPGCATVARPDVAWWEGDPRPEAWHQLAEAGPVARTVATLARWEGRTLPPVPIARFVLLPAHRRAEVLAALGEGGARGVAVALLAHLAHVAELPRRLAEHQARGGEA